MCELKGGFVAVGRRAGHGLHAHRLDRLRHAALDARRRRNIAGEHLLADSADIALERRLAGEDVEERGSETVDICRGADRRRPVVLFRAHVGRGPGDATFDSGGGVDVHRRHDDALLAAVPGAVIAVDPRSQPPVENDHLTEFSEHDVGRLDVAMNHATVVGVGDRLADQRELAEQLPVAGGPLAGRTVGMPPVMEVGDRGSEGPARDQPHRVERSAIGSSPGDVHRDDVRVFELARDGGLELEALPQRLLGRRPVVEKLHREAAPGGPVASGVDVAESTPTEPAVDRDGRRRGDARRDFRLLSRGGRAIGVGGRRVVGRWKFVHAKSGGECRCGLIRPRRDPRSVTGAPRRPRVSGRLNHATAGRCPCR